MESNTVNKAITKSEFQKYLNKGIGYPAYKENLSKDLSSNFDEKIKEYINLNQHRMSRVEKTYQISENLNQSIQDIKHKMYWLVIAEHWCGDASQTLPAFYKIASASNGKIDLKLVYRDQNPELMEAFLTNNTRSIPKLIQLDEHLNVNGIWGPRPSIAQKLVKELKSNPSTADTYANELHLWYAKDRQASLETEIEKLLAKASLFCPDCVSH